MTAEIQNQLFDYRRAFDHPVTLWQELAIAAVLVVAVVLVALLQLTGRLRREHLQDLRTRVISWLWLAPLMAVPLLLGSAWVILETALLSLLCYREFARATGLSREYSINIVIVLGIVLLTGACFANNTHLFFATGVLTVGLITMITIPQDRPQGYIQRTAQGVMGFLLFGYCFAYVGLLANHPDYRPILLLILIGVEFNDVFAYCVGKLIRGRKIIPHTSPGKTIAGSTGAMILTTLLVAGLGHLIFQGTAVDQIGWLLILGAGISALAQFGDLILSSIKRDLGIKDYGRTIPGHGGWLDRFDSLVLVPAPAYHFLSLLLGHPLLGAEPERLLTGG